MLCPRLSEGQFFESQWDQPKFAHSGVTEQLRAISNLAIQGPFDPADVLTKVCQISHIKVVLLSAKSWRTLHIKTSISSVCGSLLYKGTFEQETHWGKMAERSESYLRYQRRKIFLTMLCRMSENVYFVELCH